MKKIFSLFSAMCLLLAMCSCSKKPTQTVTTLTISSESEQKRKEIYSDSGLNEMSQNEIKQNYETTLTSLKKRTSQKFPKVETTGKLSKSQTDLGDVYTIEGESYGDIVLYIHDGLWVNEIDSKRVKFCDKMADTLDAKVYIPLYPLAPQASYNEAYEMLSAVYDELLKEEKPIIVMGDSTGASIALGLVLKLKDEGKQLPEKVVALSACADATFSNEIIKEYEQNDGLLSKYNCQEFAKLWADGDDLSNPLISPINGDFTGFPDTLMFIGTYDIFCPDNLKLYDKMCAANINISLVKGVGFWHAFPLYDIAEQAQCIELIKDFCN